MAIHPGERGWWLRPEWKQRDHENGQDYRYILKVDYGNQIKWRTSN